MSSPYRCFINTPSTGDRFDPFDIHVERLVPIIEEHIRQNYGEPDQAWLFQVHKAREELSKKVGKQYAPPNVDFDYFKSAVFRPSMRGIGPREDQKDSPGTRNSAFSNARLLTAYYDIDIIEIIGTNVPVVFATKRYARRPYYAAALALVIERARSTPHEVHVLSERAENRSQDLQHHPLVYAVPHPRREGGEGGDAAHREGPADGEELAGAAHPAGRPPGRRKRR